MKVRFRSFSFRRIYLASRLEGLPKILPWLHVINKKITCFLVDELLFEIRRSRRVSKSSSSRRVTRLVPVFILETDNRTNYKMFAEARPDG